MDEELKSIIAQIRPGLQADGGDIELIAVKDGVVSVVYHFEMQNGEAVFDDREFYGVV